MRKLASIKRIDSISPIPGADKIEVATVGGWQVVVRKGEFEPGQLVTYIEIDSWVSEEVAPFLFKGREYNGVKGERLRTIKLRGQISQGLILPASSFYAEGEDVTEFLGIQKWEKPVSASLGGLQKGNFPDFIPKTDQERIQNLPWVFDNTDTKYEVTVKLDGSSMTVYSTEGKIGVCSRNIELKLDQEGNTFVDTSKKIFTDPSLFHGYAIQGELMGPRIQGNREGLKTHEFYVFDIFDIDKQLYLIPKERMEFCNRLGLKHVPILTFMTLSCLPSMKHVLEYADNAKSLNNPVAEGVVFKSMDGQFSFKVISNKYLLEE